MEIAGNMSNKQELSESDLEIKRTSWQQIREIIGDNSLSDLEKLRRCRNVSAIYAALTGDNSLFPPNIREEQRKTLTWLKVNAEKIEKRKAARARDEARGQNLLC